MKELDKDIIIRKMLKSDIEEAMIILSRWNMAPVAPSPDKPDPERSSIDIGNAFVAVYEGNVVGVASYIILSDTVAETASLAVDPRYRGGGIGYKLQRARLEEMYRRGIRKVRTETDRMETIDWYKKKFGYREAGNNPKKHDFSLADIDEWTVLELDLDDYFKTGVKPHGRE
jgi:3-keto-5-aminohexanoate cleavage enzyme